MERDEKGRFKKGSMYKDFTGEKNGYLEAIKLDHMEGKTPYWLCKCHKCGKEKVLTSKTFRTNKTCGCRTPYSSSERLYVLWMGIRQRCNNPNHISYDSYGAKGIKVCEEWNNDYMSFKNWALKSGYDEKLPRGEQTIDRIDYNGDYCPENCKWITIQEQQRNKRNVKNYEYNGETHSIPEWAEILGIDYRILKSRIFVYGWDVKDAFERPVGKTHGKNYIYVMYNGEEKSLIEISKETGIAYSVLKERYEKGISIEETVTQYKQNNGLTAKKYEYNGERLSISEWSKKLGVSEDTLRYRLKKNRSYDEVFTNKKYTWHRVKKE